MELVLRRQLSELVYDEVIIPYLISLSTSGKCIAARGKSNGRPSLTYASESLFNLRVSGSLRPYQLIADHTRRPQNLEMINERSEQF